MEGVLVSAKREGSNKTITVVSDAKGRYAFPASRLEPGKYAVTIRAVGYDLAGTDDARGLGQRRRDGGSEARQNEGPRRAALERRVAAQRPRHRPAEAPAPELRRLPHARQDHDVEARRRRLRADDQAHGHVCEPEHVHQAAEAPDRARHRPRRRRSREAPARAGRVLRHASTRARRARGWTVRAEALRAAEGTRHARRHHRVGSAAPDDTAARRRGGFEGHGLVSAISATRRSASSTRRRASSPRSRRPSSRKARRSARSPSASIATRTCGSA